jgi:predicted MFS family arabinose efflux permease
LSRTPQQERFGVLYAGPFLSYVDRFAIVPLLVPIAQGLDESLASVTVAATLYFFLYGAMQPVYGILSDRVGRVRVMRAALVGLGLASLASAAAPTLGVLVAARAVAGGCSAALLPTALVYIGDRVPFERRQRLVANVLAMGGMGTALAILGAGVLAEFASWRLAFVVPAVAAPVLALLFARLPESLGSGRRSGAIAQIRSLLARRWVVFLLIFALAEGAVILGFLTFLAPALEGSGESSAVAGLVVAVYGVATVGGAQAVKRLVGRVPPSAFLLGGGSLLIAAYLVAALSQDIPGIFIASVLVGIAFSSFHSTVQTWATEVAPDARGTATSLFVTAVFTGAALATFGASGLAAAGRFGALFLIAGAITVPVVVVGTIARARYWTPRAGTG